MSVILRTAPYSHLSSRPPDLLPNRPSPSVTFKQYPSDKPESHSTTSFPTSSSPSRPSMSSTLRESHTATELLSRIKMRLPRRLRSELRDGFDLHRSINEWPVRPIQLQAPQESSPTDLREPARISTYLTLRTPSRCRSRSPQAFGYYQVSISHRLERSTVQPAWSDTPCCQGIGTTTGTSAP